MSFYQDSPIDHLLTDSRRLIFPATTLFFALPGPRRSGEQFVDDLYQRGVRNFVVGHDIDAKNLEQANVLLVKNPLAALQQLAAFHRARFDIPVIGITGSNGKTIVKEWLNQLLQDDFHIVRSPRSYNSQVGVPLSVWQMSDSNELGIFEAGISQPDEMKKLEKIIKPTIGIFTNIGEAHSGGFKNRAQKIEEKLRLFKDASVLIYNGDDEEISESLDASPSFTVFSWGTNKNAKVRVRKIEKTATGANLEIEYNAEQFPMYIPFRDDASIQNIGTCIATLLYMRVEPEKIRERLLYLSPVAMRLELKSGINHCSIINDSYSTDLNSLRIALDFLLQQQQHARRSVILSDILQSGQKDKKLYQQVAGLLHEKKVDRLIGIGEHISAARESFGQILETEFFPTVEQFDKNFHRMHFNGETILLKGARVFEFERIDRLFSAQVHQTVLEIDLNAMAGNLKEFQKLLWPETKIMAMVKAFSYGGGSFEIANLLQFHKVDWLGVAYADEAIELRKSGIGLHMMVMNPEHTGFDSLLQYQLEPVIYSFRLLEDFEEFLNKQGVRQFPVHIELETGMNRLGFPLQKLDLLGDRLTASPFTVRSVFTHLAASEEAQQDYFTRNQAELFMGATSKLQQALPYPFLKHIANSAAIIRYPEFQMDMVRLGIGLYGIDSAMSESVDLREVSTLKSTIAQIKEIESGVTVGYNRRWEAQGNCRIATVGIGYADGYPRTLGNGNGKMLVKGRLAPVIGTVCMDMTMIDITGIDGVSEGDEVIVFGGGLSVSQLAKWAQTIPYEILTGVSQRVKRVYYEE